MDNNKRTNHFLPDKLAHRTLWSGIHHNAFNLEYKDFIFLLRKFLPKFKRNVFNFDLGFKFKYSVFIYNNLKLIMQFHVCVSS
jgi:hypothetical protein